MPRSRMAALAGAAMLTGLGLTLPPYASSAAQPRPRQVKVIPADAPDIVPIDHVFFAGATGFLHVIDEGLQWTTYATGHSVPADVDVSNGVYSAGGDSIQFKVVPPEGQVAGDASDFDLAAMRWRHFALPAGVTALAIYGNSVIAAQTASPQALSVINYASNGASTTTPITGLPDGAQLLPASDWAGSTSAVVLAYKVSTGDSYALLNLATGVATPIPDPRSGLQQVMLTPTRVGLYDPVLGALVYSRADLSAAPGTAFAASSSDSVALLGNLVVEVPEVATCAGCPPATAAPLAQPVPGAIIFTLLPLGQASAPGVIQASNGSVLIIGGNSTADYAVRKYVATPNLSHKVVLPLTSPVSSGGLTSSQGLVRHVEDIPSLGYRFFNHQLDPNTSSYAEPPEISVDGGALEDPWACKPRASCVHTIDGNQFGLSYLMLSSMTRQLVLKQQRDAASSPTSSAIPSSRGTIVDASPDFVIVDGQQPTRQYIARPGQGKLTLTRKVTGAALWFDTLWSADGPGHLRAMNLLSKKLASPISTGVHCTPTEAQATSRWLYWTCGTQGPAGVYDLRRHVDITVPAGRALLGDGYLVRAHGTTLVMSDFHADKLARPVTLTSNVRPSPAADTRDITWAVDKYSGDVAYVRPDDSISVVSTGVPPTAPAIGSTVTSPDSLNPSLNRSWSAGLGLTRPVTSWRLTIRSTATGKAVHIESGGAARLGVDVTWNGRLAGNAKAAPGRYQWTLTVVAPGSARSQRAGSGVLIVKNS